jgi:hypothetical protein
MARRKQNTIWNVEDKAVYRPQQDELKINDFRNKSMFIPEFPLSNKSMGHDYPDSLQRFQWELESAFSRKR